FIDTEEQITLTSIGSGLIAIIGLYFFYKRLKNQDIQRVDDRFNSAINLLGSSETSARTGAVYVLHELALEEDKYRQQIVQILCSHVRSKTSEAAYQKTHKERPSNEIQTTLNLLLKEKECGLYTQGFAKVSGFPRADFEHAYLVRADFWNAQCQGANFWDAQCQEANFNDAQCQGAIFWNTQCQRANFWNAQCQGANFWNAQCQGADFWNAQCQGAIFWNAQCQEANFRDAQCQGAIFSDAQCQGAIFSDAQCQGAYTPKGVSTQTLSSRIGKETEFETLQLEGEIAEDVIKNIENSKNYLDDYIQTIIEDNTGKKAKYGTPKGCITGILENSEQLQAIIKKDWKKLEQLNKKQHD
ncbi:pentapeptide repeat-containing protein, partial [bacterium endosymbiont of Bathymodiolus sp. 5 South]|uniref:pentapeptide repeat-containing protein n=1 Tax=bacterium endosymbiont of Bathymodiolus sp. 5 South TaxID=1181670 RepID=UPI0010B2DCC2